MRQRIRKILTDAINIPHIRIGDIIVFSPNSELTLSYDNDDDFVDGIIPSDIVRSNIWISDGYVDDEIINVNCASSHRGAGDMCSNGLIDDIIKIIRINPNDPKRKQQIVWERNFE